MANKINVEVVYALAERQKIVSLEVEEGCTFREAAVMSKLDQEFDGLNLEEAKLGIYGKAVRAPENEALKEGDRVEILRPLIIDPKAARANRAAKK